MQALQANGTETDSVNAEIGGDGVEADGMTAFLEADKNANGVEAGEHVRNVDGVEMDRTEAGDNVVTGDVNAVEANLVDANNIRSTSVRRPSSGSKRPSSAGTHEMVCSALVPDLLSRCT